MIKFNLEKALSGEKVMTRNGNPVTEITKFNLEGNVFNVYGVVKGEVCCWNNEGSHCALSNNESDLCMAPKMLSGFLNVWVTDKGKVITEWHSTIGWADQQNLRKACIDLSQFPEGHGMI